MRLVQYLLCANWANGHPKKSLATKTILVPVDFSDCSREGLEYAIGFANELGAEIVLLHATYLGYIYSSEGTALYDIPGLQKAARKNAERQMRKLVRAVKFGGVKFETVFTDASPVLDICDFAKRPRRRSDHYLDTRVDRFPTCLNREHRRESGAACTLFRFGRAIASSDQSGEPRKNGRRARRANAQASSNHENHREARRSQKKIESSQHTRFPSGVRQTSFANRISPMTPALLAAKSQRISTQHVVELRKVSLRFGDKQVLDDVSLTVAPQERLVIIGQSGAGKTTILRLILGYSETKRRLGIAFRQHSACS